MATTTTTTTDALRTPRATAVEDCEGNETGEVQERHQYVVKEESLSGERNKVRHREKGIGEGEKRRYRDARDHCDAHASAIGGEGRTQAASGWRADDHG